MTLKHGNSPVKLTQHVHNSLIQALLRGLTRADSAAIAGISDRTFRHWMQHAEDADAPDELIALAADVADAEARATGLIVDKILASVDRDWRAGAWYLERRRPDWREQKRSEVELSGPDGGPVNLGVVVLPPEAVIETESKATEEPEDPSTE